MTKATERTANATGLVSKNDPLQKLRKDDGKNEPKRSSSSKEEMISNLGKAPALFFTLTWIAFLLPFRSVF